MILRLLTDVASLRLLVAEKRWRDHSAWRRSNLDATIHLIGCNISTDFIVSATFLSFLPRFQGDEIANFLARTGLTPALGLHTKNKIVEPGMILTVAYWNDDLIARCLHCQSLLKWPQKAQKQKNSDQISKEITAISINVVVFFPGFTGDKAHKYWQCGLLFAIGNFKVACGAHRIWTNYEYFRLWFISCWGEPFSVITVILNFILNRADNKKMITEIEGLLSINRQRYS